MRCEEIKRILGQRFDAGDDLTPGIESHLIHCASCRTYADRLLVLDIGLMRLPLEESAADLAERVRPRLDGSTERYMRPLAAALAFLLVAGVGIAGWLYPVAVSLARLSAEAQAWLPRLDPREAGSFIVSQASAAWNQSASQVGRYAEGVQTAFFWTALGTMVLVLLAFNGFEAARARWTSEAGPADSRRRATKANGH